MKRALVIAAGPYPAETQVAEAVARVARAHPRLRIECRALEPLQVVSEVLTERADVGISTVDGLEHEPRLVVEPLPPATMVAGHTVVVLPLLRISNSYENAMLGDAKVAVDLPVTNTIESGC